jgi:N-dimethylarginine dimethylaminohydrolase
MVFTANAGVVKGRTFIPSHFRFTQRRGEEIAFKQFFRKKGYKIKDAAKGLYFEGEGDLLPYRDMFFGGFRFRSEIRAHERVADVLGRRLVPLELFQPRFYHLDTCFLPLDEETVLYYPKAFDAYGRKVIESFVKKPIAVSQEDAHSFACNGIRVNRTVILNRASRKLKGQLAERGYRAAETPTSEFMKAGGSVKCLMLVL